MNIEKAKMIPIEQVLYRMGIFPQKTTGVDIWFLSPFTTEKTPSFKINQRINRWYCHSSGFGGNTLDFVIKKSGCSISEALTYLKDFDVFFSFHQQSSETQKVIPKSENYINKTIPVQHLALVQYLKNRGISKYRKVCELQEVHYTINNKQFFALGFINDSKGLELRSKYTKICLGTKDITTIKNGSKSVNIYEGFFDFLSGIEIENETTDFIILNSITLLEKNINILDNYETINVYLDNDLQGDKATELIKNRFSGVTDCRTKYKEHKDLNDFLINKTTKRL